MDLGIFCSCSYFERISVVNIPIKQMVLSQLQSIFYSLEKMGDMTEIFIFMICRFVSDEG